MKKSLLLLSLISFALFSCEEKSTSTETLEMSPAAEEISSTNSVDIPQNESTSEIIDSYLVIKDALVADDSETAQSSSEDLIAALKSFDKTSAGENTENLEELQTEAIALSETIKSEDIAIQRENFQALSVVLVDFLKISGADRTLYYQYCPMYKNNTGGMWLSESDQIKNPLFGSSMLTCGSVEETFSVN